MAKARRYTLRLLALGLYAAAAITAYVIVAPILPYRSGDSAGLGVAQARNLARPRHAPAMIPAWAWSLSEWQAEPADKRGRRPKAAPRHVPAWYWDWREWRAGTGSATRVSG